MGLVSEDQKDTKQDSPACNDMSDVESGELKPTNESTSESTSESTQQTVRENSVDAPQNKGDLIVDATACPQDISYPTDLNLLNDAREESEKLIDILYANIKLVDEQAIKAKDLS